MRSRRNAGLLALLFAVLPLLNWVALVIMALVTLRRGPKEGAYILGIVLLPGVVWVMSTNNQTILLDMVAGAIIVWLLAAVLHRTHNWSVVLLTGAIIGMLVIIGLHAYIVDINAWWQAKMLGLMQAASTEMNLDMALQKANIERIANIATGLQAAAIFMGDLLWLAIARHWQSVLYNPGKLQLELHNIRMPKWASVLLVVLLLLAWLTNEPSLIDGIPILMVAFALAGLSLLHFVVKARKLPWIWLVVLYLAVALSLPYMVVILSVIALVDSFLNLRGRYVSQ